MLTEQAHVFPLSFGQERLWFLHQLEPDIPLYNIPIARRLNGILDVQALEQSLNDIVRHHEILRTTFQMVNERPMQLIHPNLLVKLPVIDLQMLPPDEQAEKVTRLMNVEARIGFDLMAGPLLRTHILRLRSEEHVLLLTVHHTIFDDWSLGVFLRELQMLYNAYKAGTSFSLAELPIQYADYAVWQHEWQEQASQIHLAYWQQQLKDAPAVLELPTDRPRPPVQTHRGATYFFTLSRELSQAVSLLSQQEEATLFMTLLAAFQVLLMRYAGVQDIVIGSPMINRSRVETESLIGFFVNTLILRTDLMGNPTFRELLGRVRKVALEAYAHADLPFEKIVDVLQPQRDMSYTPLFQVLFALQNTPASDLELTGLRASTLTTTSATAKFDLSLTITTGKTLSGVFEYSTDLYNEETIIRMVAHFRTLLEGIVAQPEQRLADFPLITKEERHHLLVERNATASAYPSDICVHQLFEAQVLKSPNAIAVTYGTQTFTYQALNERANQLAHYLQDLGVGPEVIVGIFIERSLEMVVGLLGILKAGGGYVPLDPAYPRERLVFLLEDMQLPILLTQQRLEQELPAHTTKVIRLDTDWETIAQKNTSNPQCVVGSQNLAYVIYTSGSTGKPKGVMISHRALVNLLLSMREKLSITQQDTMLATTSLSFDIAGLEIYLPLLVGAQLVIVSRELITDAEQLAAMIERYEHPMVQMTPTAWHMLTEAGWQGCQNLRMLCGGEALTRELACTLLTKGSTLVNLYGPTETTIWSALYQMKPEANISLGQPIANTQLYILDTAMQPVAMNVPGELYIGGVGLARGYLNRPELTADRFVPNPFGEEAGTRLYRTGDLVRYRSDHSIEFLGRIDQQVKIRGFRIEPGEIEAVLHEQQSIRDAVVIVREDVLGDRHLVAYLTVDQEDIPSSKRLRDHLSMRLPEYMIPSTFVFLDMFPLTPNGKLDRKRLPMPDYHRSELDATYVAPRRPIEELLADIWAQILNLEQVGIHDNLFDLGGNSIRSVQITTRTQLMGLTVTPKQLLQHQTIDKLVNELVGHRSSLEQIEKIEKFLLRMNAKAR